MISYSKKLLNSFTDIIFPPLCPLCTVSKTTEKLLIAKDGICLRCLSNIAAITEPICIACGTPLKTTTNIARCGRCIKNPAPFKVARSGFAYEGPLLSAIHLFKYKGTTLLAPTLAALAAKALKDMDCNFDKVVPIPLHKNRLSKRGFNQSLLLARKLTEIHSNLDKSKLDYKNLYRIRDTRSQIELKEKDRETNVKGAFIIKDRKAFSGKKVLLIDDVYTTGATIRECSRVLSACGAIVSALTLARVIRL